jgi:predicted dithiol-disulfide oxidoreductase (DUF899 family)
MTAKHKIVAPQDWLKARLALLAKEKEFTRLRDELSHERSELPWERVDKPYVFAGPGGNETLADLFGGRSQLIIYHFMFAPDWQAACPGCSFWADNFNGIISHLNQRDVSLVAVSRAPLQKLQAFATRMGWSFRWVSSANTAFNYDYQVSFTAEELAAGTAVHNYTRFEESGADKPGVSVFLKDEGGGIFHTYSAYARGIDILNTAYNYLDLVPKGRDESNRGAYWVRRHDEYPNIAQ